VEEEALDNVSKLEAADILSAILLNSDNNLLTEREKKVLIHRFGLYGNNPKTLTEIGKMLSYTKELIRIVEMKALAKLKGQLSGKFEDCAA
jgi:DNA-directed RNA polymerase sigma subunit (sigma70/sigma32)